MQEYKPVELGATLPVQDYRAYGRQDSQVTMDAVPSKEYTAFDSPVGAGNGKLDKVRFDPFSRLLPLFILPEKLDASATKEDRGEYFNEDQRATPWISLFYDLVAVASLSTAASNNPLTFGDTIGNYLSFFVIVWWLWASTTLYDARYQANDLLHWVLKLVQVAAFAYLGASCSGWAPTRQWPPENPSAKDIVTTVNAIESFTLISWTYTASRAVLCGQYIYQFFVARWAHREKRSLLLCAASYLVSTILCATCSALPINTQSDVTSMIALLYTGMGVEVVGETTSLLFADVQPTFALMLDRFGSFTLVFIGEGFVRVLDAFNKAAKGFGRSDADNYAQVFASTLLLFLLWVFCFNGLSDKHHMGRKTMHFWAWAHLPLHIAIYLMIVAVGNTLRYTAFASGALYANDAYFGVVDSITAGIFPPEGEAFELINIQMLKVDVTPSWTDHLVTLNNTVNDPNSLDDPLLQGVVFFSSVLKKIADDYGVAVADDTADLAKNITKLATARGATDEEIMRLETQGLQILLDFIGKLVNGGLAGTLWLLPTAGLSLLITSILHILRVEYKGRHHRLFELFHVGCGIGLALLGLLGLGPKTFTGQLQSVDTTGAAVATDADLDVTVSKKAPIFTLVQQEWAIPLATLVYLLVWLVDAGLLYIAKRRHLKRQ